MWESQEYTKVRGYIVVRKNEVTGESHVYVDRYGLPYGVKYAKRLCDKLQTQFPTSTVEVKQQRIELVDIND